MQAIRDAEAAMARYGYCIDLNVGKIATGSTTPEPNLPAVTLGNDPNRARAALINFARKATRDNLPEATCADALTDYALNMEFDSTWLNDQFKAWNAEATRLTEEYREQMRIDLE